MKTYLDAHVRCVSLMAPIVASVFLFATGLAAQQQVLDIGRDMYLGTAVHDSNLTVWPVYSSRPAKKIPGNFISLTEAQKRGKVEIREMGTSNSNQIAQQQSRRNSINETDSAVVNQLVIENKSKNPILVLAGTLLKGGKQDRQVGQDFIVPAHKTVPVGAFCVEHGRWTASRDGRATNGKFQAQETLATKPVRSSGQHENNQSQVWESVAKENAKAGKAPGSGTLMATV